MTRGLTHILLLLIFSIISAEKQNEGNEGNDNDNTINIPTSCTGLKDGSYIIKLLDDDNDNKYPLINVECNNEYMIIDIGRDTEWEKYFTSIQQWHYDIIGPAKGDMVNWNNWFIPSSHPKTKYLISSSCDICDDGDSYSQQENDESAWYMNAAGYGHFFGLRRPACDFNWDSLECKTCEWGPNGDMISYPRPLSFSFEDKINSKRNRTSQSDKIMIGVCLTEVRNAYQFVQNSWETYTDYDVQNYKPSLGINGRFCQCAKTNEYQTVIKVNRNSYKNKLKEIHASKVDDNHKKNGHKTSDNNIIYLYQKDFEIGTYRIQESGTYIIMEHIIFDFNAAPKNVKSPNEVTSDYWWPSRDSGDKYPGAGYIGHGPYLLGYFAGITIETNDVILDLNGFTLKQSRKHFYQQPFFAIINLFGQPFLPNQGPGFFGPDPHFAENVIIKNGIIGLSSHHGIQGAKNKNIKIIDIKIQNFGTHGIQFNGFDGLHLENVDIGPSANNMYLNHNYAHLRMLLPYMYKMANWNEEHMDATISFDQRIRKHLQHKYTMNDLIDIATESLDKVFKFVTSNKKFNSLNSDEERETALNNLAEIDDDFKIFINPDGLPYGAVIYGIALNSAGSAIFGWDVSDLRNSNLYISNLNIHDITHNGKEILGLTKFSQRFVVNTLLAPLNLEYLFGSKKVIKQWVYDGWLEPNPSRKTDVTPKYYGNIVTDIFIAMAKFGRDRYDEWWLGTPFIGGYNECLIDWAEGENDKCLSSYYYINKKNYWMPVGSIDGMVHSGKGTVGLKATNVDNIVLSGNINIYNLYDYTSKANEITKPIGSPQYFDGEEKLNPKITTTQQWPYQLAFSMNQIYGLTLENSNIKLTDNTQININNLKSLTGRVLGFTQWYSTNVTFEGDNSIIQINDLFAGIQIKHGTYRYDEIPNHSPEVCLYGKYFGIDKINNIGIDGKLIFDDGPGIDGQIIFDNEDDYDININKHIKQYCYKGNIGCFGEDNIFTNIGTISDDNCDQNSILLNQLKNINDIEKTYKYNRNTEIFEKQYFDILSSFNVFINSYSNYYFYSVIFMGILGIISIPFIYIFKIKNKEYLPL